MLRHDLSSYDVPNIALVGIMGVGKTTIGRRLAKRLGRDFYDSDDEIEKASGRTVAGYFRDHGEADFREGEKRVISRLLKPEIQKPAIILATGGGAFAHKPTREFMIKHALTIWLQGDIDTLMDRVSRNNNRPLLRVDDPRAKMLELIEERNPLYAQAAIHIKIAKGPHARTVNRVLRTLQKHLDAQTPKNQDLSA